MGHDVVVGSRYLKSEMEVRLFHRQGSAKMITERLMAIYPNLRDHFDFLGDTRSPGVVVVGFASRPALQKPIPPPQEGDTGMETQASLCRLVARQQAPSPR